MNLFDMLPAPPPGPPIPLGMLRRREAEGEEEEDDEEVDAEFIQNMRNEGFEDDLIKMGMKVADNHSRSREEALKIGENYIREMAK